MEELLNNPDFIVGLSGVAAFAVVVLIWVALVDNSALPERLKSVAERRDDLQDDLSRRKSRRTKVQRVHMMKKVVDWLKLTQGKSIADIRMKLLRAGFHSHDTIFVYLFMKLAMMAGGIALAIFFVYVLKVTKVSSAVELLIIIAVGVIGWMLPEVYMKNKGQKREVALRKALPDALDLMVICAEAGLSMDASFERVGREMRQASTELAEEMGLTAVELSFLPDRHKALQGLADRVPLPSMLALVNTLIQTERYGTPLSQALRVLSGEMREERRMKAEEKAARLPAILTVPMIIFILPPLFVILIGPAILRVMKIMH